MHRKSFLFGFGVSMIMISALYYLVYQIDVRRLVKNYSEAVITEQLTDDEIKARAKKLGMLAVSELPSSHETSALNEEEIIQRATELGMVFSGGNSEPDTDADQTQDANPDDVPSSDETAESEENIDSDYVLINIPKGSPSSKISLILYDAGLISDAHAFDRYTIENKLSNRISYGEFSIPKNATEQEILDILKR